MEDKSQQILAILADAKYAKTTRELYQIWQTQYFDTTSLRSIERVIKQLADSGLIEANNKNAKRNVKWQITEDASFFSVSMTPFDALWVKLLNQYAKQVLPVFDFYDRLTRQSEIVLNKLPPTSPYRRWAKKVHIEKRGQPLMPPDIDEQIQKHCYQALFDEQKIKIQYRSTSKTANPDRWSTICPLGVVIRSHTVYLVVIYDGYQDIRLLSLHRILNAEPLAEKFNYPLDFNLHQYVDLGATGKSYTENPVQVTLKFYGFARRMVAESPINETMNLIEKTDTYDKYTVSLIINYDFESWLLSLAEMVEVVEPESLKSHITERIIYICNTYSKL